jgi:hypothetical protein
MSSAEFPIYNMEVPIMEALASILADNFGNAVAALCPEGQAPPLPKNADAYRVGSALFLPDGSLVMDGNPSMPIITVSGPTPPNGVSYLAQGVGKDRTSGGPRMQATINFSIAYVTNLGATQIGLKQMARAGDAIVSILAAKALESVTPPWKQGLVSHMTASARSAGGMTAGGPYLTAVVSWSCWTWTRFFASGGGP